MPRTISQVTQTKVVDLPYHSRDMTLTSEGSIAIAKFSGVQADVYSSDLVHLYNVNLTGAQGLWGLSAQGEALFVVDYVAKGIHVVLNVGRYYSHMIPVSWQPTYAHMTGDTLYVMDRDSNKLYKFTLDSAYNIVSTDLIISSTLDDPRNLFVDSDLIAVGNKGTGKLTVFNNGCTYNLQWQYGISGQAKGIIRDNHKRIFVVDEDNQCVTLVSPDGQFIQNIVEGLGGHTFGIALSGDTMYVNILYPDKLFKYTIN
jgi:hypothetical protein